MKANSIKRSRGRPAADQISGESLKQLVRQAAISVYVQEGYAGVTVARILVASGISRPTFYRLYSNVSELLNEIVRDEKSRLVSYLAEQLTLCRSIAQVPDICINAYLRWAEETKSLAGPLYCEMHDENSPVYSHRQRVIGEIIVLFQQFFRDVAGKEVDGLVVEATLVMVEHLGHSLFWPKQVGDKEIDHRKQVMHQLFAGLMAQ